MTNAISRALLGKIVDEVFDGAIEDPSVIEEIYAVIKREEGALSAAEPVAAMTTDYLGCEYISMDVAGIEKIAAAHSKGPTEVVYLYAAPSAPSVAVKALEWSPWPGNDQTKNGQSGRRIMRRADGAGVAYSLERVEPQSEWFYIPPGQVAGDWYVMKFWNEVAGPFKTDLEALEWCRQDHEKRIRSALSAQVQDVAEGNELGRFELWFFHHLTDDQRTALFALNGYPTTGMDTHGKQKIALKHWFSRLPAAPAKQEGCK